MVYRNLDHDLPSHLTLFPMKFATLDQLVFSADKSKETEFQNQQSKFNLLCQNFEKVVNSQDFSKLTEIITHFQEFTMEIEGLNRLKFCVYKLFGIHFSSLLHLQKAFEIEKDVDLLKIIADEYFNLNDYSKCIEVAKSGLKLSHLLKDQISFQKLIAKSLFKSCLYQESLELLKDILLVVGKDDAVKEMISDIRNENIRGDLVYPKEFLGNRFHISSNSSIGQLSKQLSKYSYDVLSSTNHDSKTLLTELVLDDNLEMNIDILEDDSVVDIDDVEMINLESEKEVDEEVNETSDMNLISPHQIDPIPSQSEAQVSEPITNNSSENASLAETGDISDKVTGEVKVNDENLKKKRRFAELGKR